MSCSTCKYLKENNKKDGQVSGSCYYCTVKRNYVNGTSLCNNYSKSYRTSYQCNTIYENGEKYYNDTKPNSFYLFILIILLTLILLTNIWKRSWEIMKCIK